MRCTRARPLDAARFARPDERAEIARILHVDRGEHESPARRRPRRLDRFAAGDRDDAGGRAQRTHRVEDTDPRPSRRRRRRRRRARARVRSSSAPSTGASTRRRDFDQAPGRDRFTDQVRAVEEQAASVESGARARETRGRRVLAAVAGTGPSTDRWPGVAAITDRVTVTQR